jgi:membrane-bound ClpP family serine protease
MSMDPLVWAVVLLLLGVALLVLELFVPSGGVIGFLAAASVLGSMFMAFRHENTTVGVSFVIAEIVFVSLAAAAALKYWPDTTLGKRIVPDLPTDRDVLPDNEELQLLQRLVGKIGVAKSLMLPSGAISIEGRTINAISEGIAIEAGEKVRVVEVRGNRVVVHPVDESEIEPARSNPDDVLSKPLEDLGLDPFDDPLQ